MVELWSKPLEELEHSDFLAIYSSNVEWFDHAFLVHRKGHVGVEMLRMRWLTANQPYKVTATRIQSVGTGTMIEGYAEGVFANNLYSLKATGKRFTYQLCIVLDFSVETGLIERVNEYYTRPWNESVPVHQYRVDDKKDGAPGLPSA